MGFEAFWNGPGSPAHLIYSSAPTECPSGTEALIYRAECGEWTFNYSIGNSPPRTSFGSVAEAQEHAIPLCQRCLEERKRTDAYKPENI